MARGKLFEGWTFKLSLPAPFDDPKYCGMQDTGLSRYNSAGRVRKSTLHAPSMRALLAYATLVVESEKGQNTAGLGAIGHQDNNFRVAEYHSANKTDCVVFNPTTGKFIASQFEDGNETPKAYTVGPGNASGSALLFCLMPVLEQEEEFQDNFAILKDSLKDGWPDMDAAFECALRLCDNIYRRIESATQVGQAGVKLAIPTTGNIAAISPLALDKGSYSPTGATYGEFGILKLGTSHVVSAPTVNLGDFVGKYMLEQRQLTAREEAMVPKLPDWYVIPREVVRVCEHVKMTTQSNQPMRNFLLRGPAGTGKTMGAQAIAAGLHLPYTLMTCSANTEISDLVGQFIPDTGDVMEQCNFGGKLPKISDIIMHPPSVYEELTGIYDDDKTEDDVLSKLIEIAVGRLAQKEEQHGQRIRYVDTPLLEAIRHGYVCELQERATRSWLKRSRTNSRLHVA